MPAVLGVLETWVLVSRVDLLRPVFTSLGLGLGLEPRACNIIQMLQCTGTKWSIWSVTLLKYSDIADVKHFVAVMLLAPDYQLLTSDNNITASL